MSVINQMLRDLDKRRANEATQYPNLVRPLPRKSGVATKLIVLNTVILLAIAAGGFWFYQTKYNAAPSPHIAALPEVIAETKVDEMKSDETLKENIKEQLIDLSNKAENQSPETTAQTPNDKQLENDAQKEVKRTEVALAKKSTQITTGNAASQDANIAPAKEDKRVENRSETRTETRAEKRTPKQEAEIASRIQKTELPTTPRERAESEYRKAVQSFNQGRAEEGVLQLKAAVNADPLHTASRQLLVNALIELRQTAEAIDVLHAGIKHQPAETSWFMSLARLQLDQNKLNEAWETLEAGMPAAHRNAAYQAFAGNLLQRLKRNKEAIEHYQAATQIAPNDGRWWLGLGLVYDAEGMVNEAKAAFVQARQSANLNPELHTLIEQKLR